ncbi:S-layer homology domain-containing protein [Paenibacillus spiritus]|uniref:S-layer homology domain-containing protein n=1 Tax=Paenibacillus spiritus TaxID=2496557 RepID=A0A5J5FZJ5_9BACL|nr:S-layer homology domain-containing protein [Paenibacillus spiritus]KAA8999731.1 S-layer homology domain-containing protein [Paenibacillus spiritus]
MRTRFKFIVSAIWIAGLLTAEAPGIQAESAGGAAGRDIQGHWAEKQMKAWAERGDLRGNGKGALQPDQSVSRAEFAAMMNRSFSLKAEAEASFIDLKPGNWAYPELARASASGYIQGYEGRIRPADPVTRQEAAVIIAKLLGLKGGSRSGLDAFTDRGQIAAWAQDQVAAVVQGGLMRGYPDARFAPGRALTRAEAVTLLDASLAKAQPGKPAASEPLVYPAASTIDGISVSVQAARGIDGQMVELNLMEVKLDLKGVPAAIAAKASTVHLRWSEQPLKPEQIAPYGNDFLALYPSGSGSYEFTVSPKEIGNGTKHFANVILCDSENKVLGYAAVEAPAAMNVPTVSGPLLRMEAGVSVTLDWDGFQLSHALKPSVTPAGTRYYAVYGSSHFNPAAFRAESLLAEPAYAISLSGTRLMVPAQGRVLRGSYLDERYIVVFLDEKLQALGYWEGSWSPNADGLQLLASQALAALPAASSGTASADPETVKDAVRLWGMLTPGQQNAIPGGQEKIAGWTVQPAESTVQSPFSKIPVIGGILLKDMGPLVNGIAVQPDFGGVPAAVRNAAHGYSVAISGVPLGANDWSRVAKESVIPLDGGLVSSYPLPAGTYYFTVILYDAKQNVIGHSYQMKRLSSLTAKPGAFRRLESGVTAAKVANPAGYPHARLELSAALAETEAAYYSVTPDWFTSRDRFTPAAVLAGVQSYSNAQQTEVLMSYPADRASVRYIVIFYDKDFNAVAYAEVSDQA